MIRLMIGRDLRPLYIPLDAAPPEGGCEISGVVTAAFPGQQVNLAFRKPSQPQDFPFTGRSWPDLSGPRTLQD
jgi:hypothetical protein